MVRQIIKVEASYAIKIKHGREIPHPRFYRVLAELAGVEYPFATEPEGHEGRISDGVAV